jgi:hypothetical protein
MMNPQHPPSFQDINRMQQQMTRKLDPRILQKMGGMGMGNLQHMMRQFQGSSG